MLQYMGGRRALDGEVEGMCVPVPTGTFQGPKTHNDEGAVRLYPLGLSLTPHNWSCGFIFTLARDEPGPILICNNVLLSKHVGCIFQLNLLSACGTALGDDSGHASRARG